MRPMPIMTLKISSGISSNFFKGISKIINIAVIQEIVVIILFLTFSHPYILIYLIDPMRSVLSGSE